MKYSETPEIKNRNVCELEAAKGLALNDNSTEPHQHALMRITCRAARIGGWTLESSTQSVTWSDEICEIHEVPAGYQPTLAEAINFYPAEHREQVARDVHNCVTCGTPFDFELELITAKGRRIWGRALGEAVRNQAGQIVSLQGAVQDISDRKQLEQQRRLVDQLTHKLGRATEMQRELAQRFETDHAHLIAAQAVAKTGSWATDLTSQDMIWSAETYRIFEIDSANLNLTHQRFIDLVHPEDRSLAVQAFRESTTRRTTNSIEHRIVVPGGRVKVVEERWQVEFDEQQKPVRFVGTCQDITERKQAERESRLRDGAIQVLTQGIVISDTTQHGYPIVFASPSYLRLIGDSEGEILGKSCQTLFGAKTDQDDLHRLLTAISTRQTFSCEMLCYKKDGATFWNEIYLNPFYSEDQLTHYIWVHTDVTDRRHLEEQLRQSQKTEAVGRLAAGIAHDFNNLLTVISGYSELLLNQPRLEGDSRDCVKAIAEAGERAAALTRQLLGFSRQTILQPKVINLNSTVVETAKLLRRLIGEDILLTTVLGSGLNRIKVDPSALDQVLINLAVNARDAMPKGGKLTIETANVWVSADYASMHLDCKEGPHVMLAMTDTGCGMAPEIMARIFEPFFTTKEVGKGTGLGLAMVYGIVQQSEGCIHVYSEPLLGTTFKIYFPAVAEQVSRTNTSVTNFDGHGAETILLVEDEDGVRRLALISLQMHGYQVITAADGLEALQILHNHRGPLHLILTDVVMPTVSGPELAESVKGAFPDVKVLFMSGYTDDAVVRHGLLQSEVAFIQKPYSPRSLVQKVRQVLDTE